MSEPSVDAAPSLGEHSTSAPTDSSEFSSPPFVASSSWDTPTPAPAAPAAPEPPEHPDVPLATEDLASSQSDEPAAPQTPEGNQNEAKSQAEVTHKLRPLVGLVVGVIALVVLAAAGLIAFLSMGDSDATDDGVAVAAMGTPPLPAESKPPAVGPSMWRQPAWAEAAGGVTAFELAANGDVPFANGRIRPTLGISCAAGETEVHLTTGGTAIIDPQTSGHMMRMTLDGADEQVQLWVASDDQRTLFATDPRGVAESLATADSLQLVFIHYVAGPVTVDFSLWGANDVVGATAESCGWAEPS